MRKIILLLIMCILLPVGSFDAAAYPINTFTEEEALITSFESTGADVLESTISCWTKLNNKFITLKQIEVEMNRISEYMNLDKSAVTKKSENGDCLNKIVLYGSKENKTYSIAIESIKQGTVEETYIVFDISIDKDYKDLITERQNILNVISKEESSINFSSCIIGTYKGRLTEKEINNKSAIALKSINAEKVEGIENDELKSISAFSGSIGKYIMSRQARVNVQLAMRYSSYDDRTYIWIGTPLIPMEY